MNNVAKNVLILALVFSGCAARPVAEQVSGASKFKSVTIKHPNFRETMDKNMSPETSKEADELIGRLMASVSAKAVNCDSTVIAQDKDFGDTKVSETVLDSTFTFKKGCDYIVSLRYYDSMNRTELLVSDGKSINLVKSELEKSKPVAKVTLQVTAAGRKFWSGAPLVQTGSDTDATIEPVIPGNDISAEESGFDLAVPLCMSKSVSSVEAGISCMNEFRSYLSAFAVKYSARSWYSNYQTGINDVKDLVAPAADESSKAVFCLRNSVNKGALTRLSSQIGTSSSDEEDFACKLSSVVFTQYSAIQDATLKLVGCK